MRILIVDDELSMRFAIKELLESNKYTAIEASNGENALDILKKHNFDAAIVDYQMPGMNGLELLKIIKKEYPHIQVIFITAFGNEKTAITAIKNGAYDYVAKPFNNEELLNRLNHIKNALIQKTDDYNNEFGYYYSPAMKLIIEKIKTIAKTDVPVLITGESGTGKELIAKLIHHYSQLEGKYVPVNCSVLPSALIESELFGAEKGSYTGAYKTKEGFFELADNGTIFLDEIGDMPFEVQAKLLRVLQEGEIYKVGGSNPIKINARVIAATNINIEGYIKDKKFREDLFYRLNGIKISLPPLRERKDEIKLLSQSFLKELNIKHDKQIIGFTETAFKIMSSYNWPGNIRELKSKIEEAVIFSYGEWLDGSDIKIDESDQITDNKLNNIEKYKSNDYDIEIINIENMPFKLTEAKRMASSIFEKKFIEYSLNKNNRDVLKTAEAIGIHRPDLYKKIKKYDIEN